MQKPNILQRDYTNLPSYYQLKLPIEKEYLIPADDPVRLLSAFVEGMDLSELYDTYDRIRKNQATPCQLLKIVLYANMNGIRSSRAIERACRRDINFMYLLEGMPAPDNATIARFISLHVAACSKDLLAKMSTLLMESGEISGKTLFIDGTKIEANANKYTFVWKKAVSKNQAKLFARIESFVAECEQAYAINVVHGKEITRHTLTRLKKELEDICKEEDITFVKGKGQHKTPIQRSLETLEGYISKLDEYKEKLKICGGRNSFSKTDHDATFMRMKEDHMGNGQLKPAYNLQHGVDAQYITWADISPAPSDMPTLIPFLKDMEGYLPFKYKEIVADAGYESEEIYAFLEGNSQEAYIKPCNYEISRTRKYRQDISSKENMDYDSANDCYICRNGKVLSAKYERRRRSSTGYERTTTVYQCDNCEDCPYKADCIKGNHWNVPLQQRNKHLEVSRVFERLREENLNRITSEYGTKLRMNRSIQAEGSFAILKEDMGFRQYLYRSKENVLAESVLAAMAYNIGKLHFKIQGGRTGTYLSELKETG